MKSEDLSLHPDDELLEGKTPVLLRYYVYELSDPNSGEVFYVGKGQRDRLLHHGRGLEDEDRDTDAVEGPKDTRLRAISSRGAKEIRRIIGRYETEIEAFAVEATLINWIYGFRNLTNLNRGRHFDTIRPKGNVEIISGIDIERLPGIRDGRYTEAGWQTVRNGHIPKIFEELKQVLTKAGISVRDFSAPGESPYNPGIGSGQLACLFTVGGVDCLLLVQTKKSQILIVTTSGTRAFGLDKLQADGAVPVNIKVGGVARYMHLSEHWPMPNVISEVTILHAARTLEDRFAQLA